MNDKLFNIACFLYILLILFMFIRMVATVL